MKTAHRVYIFACICVACWMQHETAHPDYFLGIFYGAAGSWLGPGIAAEFISERGGWGHLGPFVVIAISLAFWAVFYMIPRKPRAATALAPSGQWEEPVIVNYSRRRTSRTIWEDE